VGGQGKQSGTIFEKGPETNCQEINCDKVGRETEEIEFEIYLPL
jgi:hypothetical protein